MVLAIQRQPGHQHGRGRGQRAAAAAALSARKCRPALQIDTLGDRAETIRASVNDVQFTLLLTVFLVVMVIFLFLRNLSATIIPSLALPMSIIGTFAVMWVLDYILDNLSLMAITLAVGFVVDDAIVMLENIVRHMEMGKDVLDGVARRLARNRLHDPVDDVLARRGVHPGAVHGRHPRPAAARVRRHDRRGDPGLGLRVADADADAVLALSAPAQERAPRHISTPSPSASSIACSIAISAA